MQKRIDSLDSMRSFAILQILLVHGGVMVGCGHGNAIFFALAGFLFIKPFAPIVYSDNSHITKLDIKNYFIRTGKYYIDKIFKVLPVYYAVVFLWYKSPGQILITREVFYEHLIFINVYGALWFLQQIVIFYLVAPLFDLLFSLIRKIVRNHWSNYLCIAILSIIYIILIKKYSYVFLVVGNGGEQELRLPLMIIGMIAGFVCNELLIYEKVCGHRFTKWALRIWILYYILTIFLPSDYYFARRVMVKMTGLGAYSVETLLASVCLIELTVDDKWKVSKLLSNKFITFLGKISYSLFICHNFIYPELYPGIYTKMVISIFVAYGLYTQTSHLNKCLSTLKIQ